VRALDLIGLLQTRGVGLATGLVAAVAVALAAGVAVDDDSTVDASAGAAAVTATVDPFRILDTRTGIGTSGPIGPGEAITLDVAGVGPIPANASGIVLNVTATHGTEASYISAWPTGTEQSEASVLNITPGQDLPNMITAHLGDGQLDFYNATGDAVAATKVLAVGSYLVGMCVRNNGSAVINNNNYLNGWVMLTS
jgi:hypothetical protein